MQPTADKVAYKPFPLCRHSGLKVLVQPAADKVAYNYKPFPQCRHSGLLKILLKKTRTIT